jgi:hypothetical protein
MYCLCVNVYCTVLYYCHRVSTQLQLTDISNIKYEKIRKNETGRRTFISKREEFTGGKRIIKSFTVCVLHVMKVR